MGYNTDFCGAIRVLPKVEPMLAAKIGLFLNLRHSKILLRPEFEMLLTPIPLPKPLEPIARIPDINAAINYTERRFEMDTEIAPHFTEADSLYSQTEEELTRSCPLDYSTPEWDGYSLYSCVYLIQDPNADRSFLGWNRSEKAQATEGWLGYMTKLLLACGYQLDGTIIAQGERDDDRWTFFAHNGNI